MINLKSLICEGLKLNPLTTFQQLRNAKTITCYHASEDPNLSLRNEPLHVGSLQQSMNLIDNMKSHYPDKKFYLFELEVSLGSMSHFLSDEDPQVDPSFIRYNSYAYSNRIEFSHGLHQGSNISVVIMNPVEQVQSKKLIKVSK